MSILSITPRDITYRLVRLRRLIVIASIFPVLGMIGSIIVFGGETWYFEPMNFLLVLAIWVMFICVYIVVFPFDWFEALVAAFLLSVTLFGVSYFDDFVALAGPENRDSARHGTIVLIGVALNAAYLIIVCKLPSLTQRIPVGALKLKFSRRVKAPIDKLIPLILFKENTETEFHLTSEANANGVFSVSHRCIAPNHTTFVPEEQEDIFYAKVVERRGNTQITDTFLSNAENTEGTVSRGVTSIEEIDGFIEYNNEEISNHFNLHALIGFWITDYPTDWLYRFVDAANGEKRRAICTLPRISFLSIIARWIVRNRPPV